MFAVFLLPFLLHKGGTKIMWRQNEIFGNFLITRSPKFIPDFNSDGRRKVKLACST